MTSSIMFVSGKMAANSEELLVEVECSSNVENDMW
jgi:hypothetical protein